MQLITQSGPYCLVASAAMILDATVDELHVEIGHDGTDIEWPKAPGAAKMRGIHIQEIIECVRRRGKALTPIELYPTSCPNLVGCMYITLYTGQQAQERFLHLITGIRGILIGETVSGGGHACAWDGYKVFDPRGFTCALEDFSVRQCWILTG